MNKNVKTDLLFVVLFLLECQCEDLFSVGE